MSILHIRHIKKYLEDNFSEYIDMTGVSSEQYESKFLSRALSCYAIDILTMNNDYELLSKFIIDDFEDNGIDLVYYDDNEKKLYLVQSKWMNNGKGSPTEADMLKFLGGVKDLFHFRFSKFNSKLKKHQKLLENIIESTQTRYELVFIYTGQDQLGTHPKEAINEFLIEINDSTEIVNKSILNQTNIYQFLSKSRVPKVDLELELFNWGKIEKPHPAFYGRISAKNIITWWNDHRHNLFHKNIRNMLGDTSVNKGMKETLQSESENFWYYNNGITLVSEEIKKSAAYSTTNEHGQFKCLSCSIVNGAQTVATIGMYADQSLEDLTGLESVYIPCRIISLENSNEIFGKKITINNNRQNRIENRDFVSLDPEQIRLKNELLLEDIRYHITRSDLTTSKQSSNEFDLQEATIAAACACGDIDICTQSRREIGKIWEDINSSMYSTLFNIKTTGKYIWYCVNLVREIDKIFEEIRENNENLIGITVYGNRLITFKVINELKKTPQFNFYSFERDNIDKNIIKNIVEQETDYVQSIVDMHYKSRMIPSIFKNLTICAEIANGKKTFKQMSLFDNI